MIEDDYDGEYRYDREPLGALQGLGAGRVAYLGSTSKTLAPALRLGWMVLPRALAGAIADERGWADGGSPALDQLALASFIERGELDRHLRRMRLRYRRRRDRLAAALGEHLPDNEVGGAAAGLHVTVALAPEADVDAVLARAAARGVGVFATHHAGRPLLLVGYANIAEEAIEPAVTRTRRRGTRVAWTTCSSTSSSRSTAQSTAPPRCGRPPSSPARSTRA